jgi:hypothetical protein
MTFALGTTANAYAGVPASGSPGPSPVLSNVQDLYVAASGNDANDGLTPATAVATLGGALSKLPIYLSPPETSSALLATHLTFHLADPISWETIASLCQLTANAQITVWGDGAGQPGNDGFTEVATGVAAVTNTDVILTAAAPFPAADSYQNMFVEILTGNAAGDIRVIQTNTTNDLTPVCAFSNAVAPGDTFRITTPRVVIDVSGGAVLAASIGKSGVLPINLINLEFQGDTEYLSFAGCNVLAYGVRLTDVYIDSSESSIFAGTTPENMGNAPVPSLWDILGISDKGTAWMGWGIATNTDWINLGYNLNGSADTSFFAGFLSSLASINVSGGRMELGGGFAASIGVDLPSSDLVFQYNSALSALPYLIRPRSGETGIYQFAGRIVGQADIIINARAANANGFYSNGGVASFYASGRFIDSVGLAVYLINAELTLLPTGVRDLWIEINGDGQALFAQGSSVRMFPYTAPFGGVKFSSNGAESPTVLLQESEIKGFSGLHEMNNGGGGSALECRYGSEVDLGAGGPFTGITFNAADLDTVIIDTGSRLNLSAGGLYISSTCWGTGAALTVKNGGTMTLGDDDDASFTGGNHGVRCENGGKISAGRGLTAVARNNGGTGFVCKGGICHIKNPTCQNSVGSPDVSDYSLVVSDGGVFNSAGHLQASAANGPLVTLGSSLTTTRCDMVGSLGKGLQVTLGSRASIGTGGAASTVNGATDGIDASRGGNVSIADAAALAVTAGTGSEIIVGPGAGESGTLAATLPAAGASVQNLVSAQGGSLVTRGA